MAESNIDNKRVLFLEGQQRNFLDKAQAKLNLSSKEFARFLGINIRSLSDWRREEFLISLLALEKICQKLKIKLPQNIEIKKPFWYASKGAKVGGSACYKKYGRVGGDPNYRIKKWHEWWRKEGSFKKHSIISVCSKINIPKKSRDLAEFVGIILGDGGITKGQVTVTLHKFDDKDFACRVVSLFKKLFGISPSVKERKRKNAINIVASRSNLVKFLLGIGLHIGGKVRQQVGVPSWVNESKHFVRACLRGLFDTDGCFYIDHHFYKNKVYFNCGINFTNRSLPILNFFKENLEKFGFHPTQKTQFSVFLRKEEEITRYFKEIGTSNTKYLTKFKEYLKNKHGRVPKWL